MENQDFITRIETKKLYDQEQRWMNRAEQQLDDLLSAMDNFLDNNRFQFNNFPKITTEHLNQATLEVQQKLLERIDNELEKTFERLKKNAIDIWSEGAALREKWQVAYKDQDRSYQELLQEFQGEGDADRYIQLQRLKAELVERDQQVKQQKSEVTSLQELRTNLLTQLREVRRDKYKLRYRKANDLTKALRKKVRITLYPQGHRQDYRDYLQKMFAGLNVRNPYRDRLTDVELIEPEREASRPVELKGETRYLVSRIPRYLDPIDLAEAIRAEHVLIDGQESLLEQRFGIESEIMRRNISGLNQEQLFELETYEIPDFPVIELQISSGELGYRELNSLSVGQRCTALLSLVLLESPVPLIIDQPEDDLDNQFIFDHIVATLREEKEKRQFIIATHNANIPVSGDSELIIVLQADENHGWADEDCIGSIDSDSIKHSVERILEGGEIAFRIRKEKYGIK